MLVSDYFFGHIFEEEFLLRASFFNDLGVQARMYPPPCSVPKQMLERQKVFFMYFHRQSPNGMCRGLDTSQLELQGIIAGNTMVILCTILMYIYIYRERERDDVRVLIFLSNKPSFNRDNYPMRI